MILCIIFHKLVIYSVRLVHILNNSITNVLMNVYEKNLKYKKKLIGCPIYLLIHGLGFRILEGL